ncbi:MAG: hypothetical protein JXR77_01205 [Lentisphaeria bacterium]|nr:hypothetical protein [Lentisphaeria bacterium]
MRMRDVATLLNEMVAAGVIETYAVFGAVAQMRYTEAVVTLDADVLVALPGGNELVLLTPLYAFCLQRGFLPEGEAVRVGDWPVQFIPAFSPLTEEAMRDAEVGEVDGIPLRVVSAVHLAAIAISAGRAKDHARVLGLLEAGAVSAAQVAAVCMRHGLAPGWHCFARRFLDER